MELKDKMVLLHQFITDARMVLGDSFEQAILYGSYARGDYTENSDMDVMILTDLEDCEIKGIENQIYDAAYEYLFKDNLMISVNIKNKRHFDEWTGALPYYNNIRREGKILAG